MSTYKYTQTYFKDSASLSYGKPLWSLSDPPVVLGNHSEAPGQLRKPAGRCHAVTIAVSGLQTYKSLTEKAALSNMGTDAAHGLGLSYIREGLLLLAVKCYCQFNMKILSSKYMKPSHAHSMPSCPKTWSFGGRKRSPRDILEDSCWDAGVNFVMRVL